MAVDVRDVFMVIRAKDQASRVLNGLSRSASADFRRLQTAATLTAQRSSIDMARVRQHYANQILDQQKVLNNAISTGNKTRATAARAAIRDIGIMRQEEILGIKQEQITQREIMHTAEKHAQAKAAAREAKVEAARSAGQWVSVGAVMAIAGAAGVKALHSMAMESVEYQRQATLTLTQVDKIKTSTQELQGISTRVARSIGVPLEQLQPALYDIFSSMDVNITEAEQLLVAFSKEAVAGQVSIQDASRATIGIMNAFHIPVSRVNEVLDFQFQLVRKGVGTFGEFATQIGKATPSAVRAGQSYQTLGAMMAFMTRNGVSAAMAAASAGRALDAFANPKVVDRFAELGTVIEKHSGLSARRLRELGIDTDRVSVKIRDANGNFRGFVPVMGELSNAIRNLPEASRAAVLKELFKGAGGTIQAMRYFNLVIPRFKEQNQLFKDMMNSSGAYEAAYAKMGDSVAAKTIVLNNQWKIMKLNLGEGAIPALSRLIEIGNSVLSWFNDLSPAQHKAIGGTVAFVSVIVGLSGVLVALAGTVKIVSASLGILGLTAEGAAGRFIVAKVAAGGLLSTLGLLTAAIVLAANAKKIDQKADELGARIHAQYVRPLYERLHLTEGNTEALRNQNGELVTLAGRYGQVTISGAKAGSALQGVDAATVKLRGSTMESAAAMYSSGRASVAAAQAAGGYGASLAQASGAVKNHTLAQGGMKGAISKATDELKKEATEFDGVTRVAKVSAAKLTQVFQNQLADTRNYSRNLRILLRKGADPDFIKELMKRGPEYVAGYARGSRRELLKAQETWRKIHQAEGKQSKVLGEVATAAVREFRKNQILDTLRASGAWKRMTADQKRKITAAMHDARVTVDAFQKRVNSLKGKTIKVRAVAQVEIDRQTRLYFKTASAAIRERPRATGGPITRAAGGPIIGPGTSTSDSIPAAGPGGSRYRLSDGEFVVNAASTRKYRPIVEAINQNRLAAGGYVGALSNFNSQTINATERMGQRLANLYAHIIGKGLSKYINKALGGAGSAAIKSWIRAQDPKPYIWGGAGPGGFDCSGIVSAVLGKMLGMRGAGSGLRLFTTGSIGAGMYGLKSGLGGTLQIGVTAGTGHMAGRYGGLGFEARSTRSGIIVGSGARPPWTFARTYHRAGGGYVSPGEMRGVAMMVRRHRLDLWGDADNSFVNYRGRRRKFHNGGTLPEDIFGVGGSGNTYSLKGGETVTPQGGGGLHLHFHGPVYGGKAGAREVADMVQTELLKKKRYQGGVALGLT